MRWLILNRITKCFLQVFDSHSLILLCHLPDAVRIVFRTYCLVILISSRLFIYLNLRDSVLWCLPMNVKVVDSAEINEAGDFRFDKFSAPEKGIFCLPSRKRRNISTDWRIIIRTRELYSILLKRGYPVEFGPDRGFSSKWSNMGEYFGRQ